MVEDLAFNVEMIRGSNPQSYNLVSLANLDSIVKLAYVA
jgi:hypothetical protein